MALSQEYIHAYSSMDETSNYTTTFAFSVQACSNMMKNLEVSIRKHRLFKRYWADISGAIGSGQINRSRCLCSFRDSHGRAYRARNQGSAGISEYADECEKRVACLVGEQRQQVLSA